MDLNKLSKGDKVIAGSGIVLFIAYFLPWFKAEAIGGFGGTATGSGGDLGFIWSTFPMLIGLLMAGLVIATKLFEVKLPDLPIPWGLAYLIGGGIAAFFVVLKLLIGEDGNAVVEVSRSYGIFLATLAALGLLGGGFLKMQEDAGASPASGGDSSGSAPF